MESSTCVKCDDGKGNFYIDHNVCYEKCSKGKRLSNKLECDDGNIDEGDGCNEDCTI